MSDISDVDIYMPGLIKTTIDWFRLYKVADGKPANKFAFNSRAKTKNFTVNVLRETHQQWCTMMASKKEANFPRAHTSHLSLSKHTRISQEAAQEIVNIHPECGESEPIDQEKIRQWHHVPMM